MMRVLVALVAIATAQSQEDCKLDQETSLLQLSSKVKTRQDAAVIADALHKGPQKEKLRKLIKSLKQRVAKVKRMHPELSEKHGPVDFVYCWAGEKMQLAGKNTKVTAKNTVEGYGFNEMELSFKTVKAFAPWYHKVYVLVNGPAKTPKWAKDAPRFQIVDRCSLFPKKSDCPTKNTAACQSVAHRIPGLKEKWVYMEDDYMLLNPVHPSDWFNPDGKPFLTSKPRLADLHELYPPHETLKDGHLGWNIPPVHTPKKIDTYRHRPVPMLTSFSRAMEMEYPAWHAFVRSHKTRFKCCHAKSPVDAYIEEDFVKIWPAMLLKHDVGVLDPQMSWMMSKQDVDCRCQSLKKEGMLRCLETKAAKEKLAVVEDCTKADAWNEASKFIVNRIEYHAQEKL